METRGLWVSVVVIAALLASPAEAQFWKGFAEGFNRSFQSGPGSGGNPPSTSFIAPGFYKVTAKRKGGDIYEISGGSYIKTRRCYEYTFGDDAVMEITASAGYSIGAITFMNSGRSCDIEAYMN